MKRNQMLVTHLNPKSPVAEQYRTIRTNIQFASINEQIQTYMVTSPMAGEGKTTTITNLAVVMAQQEKKVLIIDADTRKPSVHYAFQRNNIKGVTNVLTGQLSLKGAVIPTAVPNLDILASGPIPPNPSELLASPQMEQLLKEACRHYDIVLVDTPPVLIVSDAQIMANRCQGSILVVNSGKTESDSANQAKDALIHAKAKLLGVVLNRKNKRRDKTFYYYGRQ
ncbi:capsular biosynthesis protein [Alkalihalobacillus macyae]|uniref:non-specific protein-tyrosine kinase n=2 Tax=Guptibacillus hwajinpoensis TaxID=208199 RepID=A0A0J6CWX1_9BACL|nr:capsular biosynthesis protein [Alkalihalobacillus macyae]